MSDYVAATFNSDVDNYMGVKTINNYIIASLNDLDDLGR